MNMYVCSKYNRIGGFRVLVTASVASDMSMSVAACEGSAPRPCGGLCPVDPHTKGATLRGFLGKGFHPFTTIPPRHILGISGGFTCP